jgi:hypothetical protein
LAEQQSLYNLQLSAITPHPHLVNLVRRRNLNAAYKHSIRHRNMFLAVSLAGSIVPLNYTDIPTVKKFGLQR